MRFDYLRSARPWPVQRVLEFRVPERLHGPLTAVCAAAVIVGGAWSIEAYRLNQALNVQAGYQQRYDRAQAQLRSANVYEDRVRAVVSLDRRVRAIASSGESDARTLAEIANRLPAHAWLTGIAHDASGLSLQGRATNLEVLSAVMRGLIAARRLHSPQLVHATAEKQQGKDAGIKYEIHVDAGTR